MKITFKKSDYVHLPEKSQYNHNYYQHKQLKFEIYEECDENYESFDFYLVENGKNVYLGHDYDSIDADYNDSTNEVEFDYKS